MVTLFYWQLIISKWVILNLSIDLPCSPPVGQFQSSQNLNSEVTSCEFYDNFCTHFLRIFDEKTCTEVVAVLTILYALGDMLFGINTTLSVSYTANPLKNSLLCVV